MTVLQAKYTPDQREAVAIARVDAGMSTKDISAAAAAGQLVLHGASLPAFEIPAASIGTYAKRLRDERAGRASGGTLGAAPHRDAIETLRIRMVNAADATLAAWERQRPNERDVERGRQIARLIREAAALPARTDPEPPKPGAKINGEQLGGQTRGGIAGSLLADHRATTPGTDPAPTPSIPPNAQRAQEPQSPPQNTTHHDHATQPPSTPAPHHDQTTTTQNNPTPGSAVRALAARLGEGV